MEVMTLNLENNKIYEKEDYNLGSNFVSCYHRFVNLQPLHPSLGINFQCYYLYCWVGVRSSFELLLQKNEIG